MSHGARNWPFLTLTGLAGARGGDEKIGLAAEEGRDLQNVHCLGERRALIGLMHVGRDGKSNAFPDLGEDRECCVKSQPSRARGARAVRLVEGTLIDKPDLEPCRDLLQRLGCLERMGPALERARTRDQGERQGIAEFRASGRNDGARSGLHGFVHGRTMGPRGAGVNWGGSGVHGQARHRHKWRAPPARRRASSE